MSASQIMMVCPKTFGFNQQTATDNAFQKPFEGPNLQDKARAEFDQAVAELAAAGIEVHRFVCPVDAPDAMFPNNWVSFHDRDIVLYPMKTANRRIERQRKWVESISAGRTIHDFSAFENDDKFCEGTGSLVFDHQARLAFAARSERTHPEVATTICQTLGYQPIFFDAYFADKPVYHTNVVMHIGPRHFAIAWELLPAEDRRKIRELVSSMNKVVIDLSTQQVENFCGNMLQLDSPEGPRLVMSKTAETASSKHHFEQWRACGLEPLVLDIGTLETIGGGSARCMICEVS